jgi:hypothetical protein
MEDGAIWPGRRAIYKYTVILLHCSKMSIGQGLKAMPPGLNKVPFVTKSSCQGAKALPVTIGDLACAAENAFLGHS